MRSLCDHAYGSGGSESSPPPPVLTPTPTPRSLAISPDTAFLKVNQTETFSGMLTMSDGQTQSVQPTWQSDNTSVLTFDGGGTARGLRNGTATITASNQGLSTTRLIRVAPDYQGTWAGDYVVVRCDATAEYRAADFCHPERGFAVGRLLAVFFAFTQQRESISGDMDLGALEGTASGSLDGNGQLSGSGNVVFTAEGVPVVFAVGPLVLNADGNRLTGRFTVTVTIAGVPGQGVRRRHQDRDQDVLEYRLDAEDPARVRQSAGKFQRGAASLAEDTRAG